MHLEHDVCAATVAWILCGGSTRTIEIAANSKHNPNLPERAIAGATEN